MRLISSLPKYVYLQTRKSCFFTGHDLDNYFWLVRVILEKCYCQAYEQTKLHQVGQSYHDHNNWSHKKKSYQILDIVQTSADPHPLPPIRQVWTQKVWTLRLGSDPPSPYCSLDILTQKV